MDVVVDVDGRPQALVEVKVLSGLGPEQLERYDAGFPDVPSRLVLSPWRAPVDPGPSACWTTVTWSPLLKALSTSENPWVRTTAAAWSRHLEQGLPIVEPSTRWDDVGTRHGLGLVLRARMDWLHERLDLDEPWTRDLVTAGIGGSPVLRICGRAAGDGHAVHLDLQEARPPQDFPRADDPAADLRLRGPRGLVGLTLRAPTTQHFDWDLLHQLWRDVMQDARADWVKNAAKRKGVDKIHHARIVAAGAPPWLGVGYGDAWARKGHAALLGARFQLEPSSTLDDVLSALHRVVEMLGRMDERLQARS